MIKDLEIKIDITTDDGKELTLTSEDVVKIFDKFNEVVNKMMGENSIPNPLEDLSNVMPCNFPPFEGINIEGDK